MRWSDQQRWLVGRCLDVFRLTTIYGVVLVLAAGPFSLLELAGSDCSTPLIGDNEVKIANLGWNYAIVAMTALLSVTLFCVNALPDYPDNWAELAVAIGTALLPLVWSPMLVGLVSSPTCPDSSLLVDEATDNRTLPSGVDAQLTLHSVADEAGQVMALGIVLTGLGSTSLSVYLATEAAAFGRPLNNDKLISLCVMMTTLIIYLGGGSAVHDATHLHSDHWSQDPQNNDRVKKECNSGSGKVFGRLLAANDRDAFANLNVAGFSLGLLTMTTVVLLMMYDRFIAERTTSPAVIGFCGGMFSFVHFLMSVVVSQAVFVGSNPSCVQSTFASDKTAARGLTALAYGNALVALYTVVATPSTPLTNASWSAPKKTATNRPDVSYPSPSKTEENGPRIIRACNFDGERKAVDDSDESRTGDSTGAGDETEGVLILTDPIISRIDPLESPEPIYDHAAADAPPALEEGEC